VEWFGARLPASSTSQPSLVADMLELLELTRGVHVLEIGAGTGYNAALLAELVGDQRLVITVDVAEDVVAQTRRLLAGAGYPGITVLCRDGFDGVPERAPFDRIVATVGCADVSPQWAEQLAEDGRLLVPLRHAGGHPLLLLQREDGGLRGRVARWSGFMDARGQLHADGLWSMGMAQPDSQGEVGEREPWPEFGAYETDPGPDDPVDERDFLFYLSLVDRRACWAPGGVALSDGHNGWATADPSGIRWWRDETLADDLDRHHAQWLALGRPTLGDYRVAFVPIEEGRPPPPTGWALDRPSFRELLWLEEP